MPPATDEHDDVRRYREEKAARQHESMEGDSEDDVAAEAGVATAADEARHEPPPGHSHEDAGEADDKHDSIPRDTSQVDPASTDVKQRRKQLRLRRKERAEREVTDPVTHLPVTIHDFTDEALKETLSEHAVFKSDKRYATGLSSNRDSTEHLQSQTRGLQQLHQRMSRRFPPPDFDLLNQNITAISNRGLTFGLAGLAIAVLSAFFLGGFCHGTKQTDLGLEPDCGSSKWWILSTVFIAGAILAVIAGVRDYTTRKISNIFQDEVWDAHRQQLAKDMDKQETETTIWLNSVLGAVWPLINPDLFLSLSDTLEDVMQASLPKLVRMVSVEDIGQGSESIRILGIQWLPTGAASESVTPSGNLSPPDKAEANNGSQSSASKGSSQSGDPKTLSKAEAVAEGMEGEEGDFVNLEVAFAYRTRSSSRSLKDRTKDMHLFVAFYLPGNIKIPVWVDLLGIIGTMRMRLQLCPDPPFFSLCTFTFMGQPKVDVRCVPLSRRGLNIMDIPLISNFVQSAIDAAVAQYVAPKSLTLDLKDILAGDDFKKDTVASGILMIHIKRGYDFKMGDSAIPLVREASSDPYVSVGWAKFGKVLWSTRILKCEMEPCWDETCFALVTPEEVNIDERLRVQLWDSDRFTADDDLGRIEVGLKELMQNPESRGKTWHRTDGFRALKAGDNMPGKLEWSVGYYPKARIQQCQLDKQTYDPKIRSMEQLKVKVDETCERKLREFMIKEGIKVRDEEELEQQIILEMKAESDAMICSAPPPDDYPSGLFSIQIHNITGLEVERLNRRQADDYDEESDEEEEGDGLPSSYCTVIINHSKTFKTRTKPQNAKPFFNAGCERFVRDWRDCEVFVSVRDARLHEDNPLLGIVHLPLAELFKDRSQVMGWYPLSGGIGRGRVRLSMVWRSVRLQAPPNLLGWQYGTVDVHPIAVSEDCQPELKGCKLKLKTDISMGKLRPVGSSGKWMSKKEQDLHLAVRKRYSSCMAVEFRDKRFLGEKVSAFCVLWLKDIPDEEEEDLQLPIWKGDYERATSNCLKGCGEKLGTLKIKLTFLSGMGIAHSRWASRNQHTRDVVEVIDTARDNLDLDKIEREAGIVDEEASSDSDSSSDGGQEAVPDGSAQHKQGLIDQLRDYKRRDKALHRQHRGLMQWKVPRTARWMRHKIGRVEESVSGLFDHHNKQPGIETEV
ncbi:meiotically up-regulated protein [Metarhizium album ARSEF 1941]|uniref:Meiotically up-regulated protein n=1 Tax=Metarhizium album (strain ARSEF 1941) TaxID=1081103 RepID=A0A0B2WTQ2_METAS|nr:meiotically up-regulated protein [Metarhizium album ARSEF 1941]KHN96842.1 meiotically up-regulated protein [Metarhizium album ARSEF 1941]